MSEKASPPELPLDPQYGELRETWMSGLPDGWALVKLDDVGQWGSGGTPTRTNFNYYSGGTIPWLVIGDLNDGYVHKATTHITELGLQNSSAKLLPAQTILVAMYGSIGKLGITAIECATNQAIAFCRPNLQVISLRYLFYALYWAKPTLLSLGQGGAQQNISQGVLRNFQIPLAPLCEQTRIAAQLDKLLARIQACNDRIDAIPALLKRFRRAVLDDAILGELCVDLTSSPEIEPTVEAFPMVSLGRLLAEPLRNGKSVRDGNGLPVLRLTSLKAGRIDLSETKLGDWSGVSDINRFLIQNGDYLVSRGNGSKDLVGRGGLVSGCAEDIAFPDTMIRIRLDAERVDPDYLSFVWSSQLIRVQIEQAAKTTAGIWKVSQPDLENVRLPLPTLNEQREIVRKIKALYEIAERVEARYIAAQASARRLTPLLLAKAFRGELIPQDPNDEHARVLLESIAVEQTTTVAQPRTRKLTAGRKLIHAKENATMTKSRQDDDVQGLPYLARHLRLIGGVAPAEVLFKASELPVADFYKQLAWEVAQGHLHDGKTVLELGDAA